MTTFFDQILSNLEDHLLDYSHIKLSHRPETFTELHELAQGGSTPDVINNLEHPVFIAGKDMSVADLAIYNEL